ncbi:MAG: hydrogenase maturation protease [Candidatus Binatia bacterium]
MSAKILVAGLGNIFLGDDGFGVEVARRLRSEPLARTVHVEDFGIRGVHLVYQLLDGYDAVILIDAVARGGPPGTLYLLEPDIGGAKQGVAADAHDMDPESVLHAVRALGGRIGRVLLLGCEVADTHEHIGLSDGVECAVPEAMRMIRNAIGDLFAAERIGDFDDAGARAGDPPSRPAQSRSASPAAARAKEE